VLHLLKDDLMNRPIIIAYFVLLCNRNAYLYN